MKKSALLAIIFLISPITAFAKSESSVNVTNEVHSSSDSNATTETNITVETNGRVTHYSSDKPGNVQINSVNGESEIKVNGVVVSGTPTSETNQTPTASPSPKPTTIPVDNNNGSKNIFNVIEELFKKLFFFWR